MNTTSIVEYLVAWPVMLFRSQSTHASVAARLSSGLATENDWTMSEGECSEGCNNSNLTSPRFDTIQDPELTAHSNAFMKASTRCPSDEWFSHYVLR